MIDVKTGDLLTSSSQTLVNTVNCVGVMGKGIALQFKNSYPEMFADYRLRCNRGEVSLGEPYIFKQLLGPNIINFPTKDHWRSLARLEDIIQGMRHLYRHYEEWGVTSIAMPPLGCGNGQLEWKAVGPVLYRMLEHFAIPVELYAPNDTPPNQLGLDFLHHGTSETSSRAHQLSPAAVALIEIVRRIQDDPFHWPIGRTIFQKIAYVATRVGIPTGLRHERASYGPYAPGLDPLKATLVRNGLLAEEKEGNRFSVKVGPHYDAIRVNYANALAEWDDEIDRVTDLFLRIHSVEEAELTATVLFAGQELQAKGHTPSESEVLEAVQEWKVRRKWEVQPEQMAETIRALVVHDWLLAEASHDLPIEDHLIVTA